MIDKLFRVLRAVFVPLIAVSLLASHRSAHAQGTMGQLAGPMSSDELHVHLDRFLEFDLDQALAMGPLHEQYLAEFRILREGRIAAFLESARDLESGGAMPDIRKVRKYADQQASIQTSIRKLDDRLFDQIAQLFPEESLSAIQRARNSRARIRARSGLTAQMGLMGTQDLWLVADQLQLTPDQRGAFSSALLSWEDRSTALSKQAARAGSSMMIKMVEKFDELGFSGEEFSDLDYSDPEDAQKLQQLMMTVQQVFMEVQQESGEAIAQLRRLNSRTVRDLDGVIEPWVARNFKNEYVQQAGLLGFVGYDGQYEDESIMDRAAGVSGEIFVHEANQLFRRDPIAFVEFLLASEELSPEVRERIDGLLQAYLQEDLDLLDDGIKLSEDFDPTMMGLEASAMMGDGMSQEEFESAETPMMKLAREIREVRERRDQIRLEMIQSIAQAIDFTADRELEERVLRAMRDVRPDPEAASRPRVSTAFTTGMSGFTFSSSYSEPTPWLVGPVDRDAIDRLTDQLGDDAWLEPVFDSMYVDYRSDWSEQVTPAVQRYESALSALYANAGAGGDPTTSSAEVHSRLRAAIEAIRDLDRSLFDSLAATSTDGLRSTVELERDARLVDIAIGGSGQSTTLDLSPNHAAGDANLIEILAEFDLTSEERSNIAGALGEQLDSVIASRRVLQEHWIELAQLQHQQHFDYLWEQADNDPEGSRDAVMVMPTMISPSSEGLKEDADRVDAAEEAFVVRVVELLPEDSREEFRRAVRIAQYPAIYAYDDDIEATFELTDRMIGLRAEQRAALEVLKANFDRDWVESGHRLLECANRMVVPEGGSMDSSVWQDYLDAQMNHELLDFDRSELSAQGLRRIAALLDAEQRRRIPAISRLASERTSQSSPSHLADVPVNEP